MNNYKYELMYHQVWDCDEFLDHGLVFSVTRSLCLAADP